MRFGELVQDIFLTKGTFYRNFAALPYLGRKLGIQRQDLAKAAQVEERRISRIEFWSVEPSLTTGYFLAQAVGETLHNLLSFSGFEEKFGPWIILPYSVEVEELRERVAYFNDPSMRDRYLQADRYYNRLDLYLSFREVIAHFEALTPQYQKYQRAEYLAPDPETIRLREEKLPKPGQKLELGAAFAAVRRLRNLSNKTLARQVKVSPKLLSRFENNQLDLGLFSFDKVARGLGLTIDELIYIQYPPAWKWPLLLPYENSYVNQDMVARNLAANLQFCQLEDKDLELRAQLMVAFRDWLKAEWEVRKQLPGADIKATNTPIIFELLDLYLPPLEQDLVQASVIGGFTGNDSHKSRIEIGEAKG